MACPSLRVPYYGVRVHLVWFKKPFMLIRYSAWFVHFSFWNEIGQLRIFRKHDCLDYNRTFDLTFDLTFNIQDVQSIFDRTRKFLDGKLDFVASAICAQKKDFSEPSPSAGTGSRKSQRLNGDQGKVPSTEKQERPFDELLDKIVISLAATWSIMQAR